MTIDLLGAEAYAVGRNRAASDHYPAWGYVDVFSDEQTYDLLVRRAWAWCVEKIGAPVRSNGLFPGTLLHTPSGASLAFHKFDFHPPGVVSLVCVPDLLWCSSHYEVMTPNNHRVIENFT